MLGIYTRLSKEDEESNSINNQKREGVAFATKNNFEYRNYNEGEGISGTLDIADRPVLSDLMTDINKGIIKQVWMRNQNRLDRNSLTFFIFIDAVKKSNVDVYFGDGAKLDFNDPDILLHSSILSSLSTYQAGQQSKSTKKALKDNAIEGKAHGISPYGYTSENGFIVTQGTEAEVVKDIFKLSLEGKGTNKIAEILNTKEIATRYNTIGKGTLTTKSYGRTTTTKKKDIKWSGNTIRSIIKNTIYKGVRTLKSGTYKAPHIIEPHLWQQVNDNLKANRNNSGQIVKHKYLLKGIIRCGKCGRNYYGRTRVSLKDNFYMCSGKRFKGKDKCSNRSINIKVIDEFIWLNLFLDKTILKETIKYFKETNSNDKLEQIRADLKEVYDELNHNEKEHQNLITSVRKGLINDDDVAKDIEDIKRIKVNLSFKQLNLFEDEKFYLDIESNKENMLYDLKKSFTDSSLNEKKELIKRYIKEIQIRFVENAYFIKIIYNKIDTDSVFIIDINYNVIFTYPYKSIITISDKSKAMNQEQASFFVREIYKKFLNASSELKSPLISDYENPDKWLKEMNQHIEYIEYVTEDYKIKMGLDID